MGYREFKSPPLRTLDELKCLKAGEYLVKNKKWDISSVVFHPPLSYLTHGFLLKDRQYAALIGEYKEKFNLISTSRVSEIQYGDNKMILEDVLLLPVGN